MLVGAGPTAVEMAGQIGEIAHDLKGDFRSFDLHEAQILLVETGDRVLQEYPASLSAKALRSLQSLGVTARLSHTVTDLDDESVTLRAADGSEERIPTHTVVWAAGVIASDWHRCSRERPASTSTAPDASRCQRTCRCPVTPRCSRSAT